MPYSYPIIKEQYRNGGISRDRWNSHSWDEPRRPLPILRASTSAPGYWSRINLEGIVSDALPIISPGQAVYAQAYDRLFSSIGTQAELALTLWERESALRMIATRCGQLVRMIRNLKRGRLPKPSRKRGQKAKLPKLSDVSNGKATDLTSAWLEYTFGWAPLVNDIASAVEVLQSEPAALRAKGSASYRTTVTKNDGIYGSRYTASVLGSVRMSCYVRVTNPNLRLASQLGFTNPAYLAWDLVPFSFVVDWFLPVGKFLSQMDNLAGLELERPCRNTSVDVKGDFYFNDGRAIEEGFGVSHYFTRSIGPFPNPGLTDRLRVPQGSLWLAATSVALVVQQLSSLRRNTASQR